MLTEVLKPTKNTPIFLSPLTKSIEGRGPESPHPFLWLLELEVGEGHLGGESGDAQAPFLGNFRQVI